MQTITKNAFLLAALAIAGLLTLSPLSAQIRATQFDVPFQFHAGNAVLPAGEYRVSIDPGTRHSLITVSPNGDGEGIVLLPMPAAYAEGRASEPTVALVFHKYGEDYFLRQVRHNGSSQILNMQETKAEKAAARQGNLRQVALVHPR